MNCILEQMKRILIIWYLWQVPCRRSSFSSTFMKKRVLHVDAVDEDHVGNMELLQDPGDPYCHGVGRNSWPGMRSSTQLAQFVGYSLLLMPSSSAMVNEIRIFTQWVRHLSLKEY